ncbi:MAG: hypothetical protein CL678_18175 [Bdellovibrionaceae bacterium]|nr:hypothetical protein [Pseudobdellovibrionaceae bacterium]
MVKYLIWGFFREYLRLKEFMRSRLEKKKIFIGEDESELRDSLVEYLESYNFQVVHSGRVSDSLFKLKNQKFDLIVLDIRFPDGTADRVIHQIRSDKKDLNYATPILVGSGNLDMVLVQEIGNKINGALVKPYSLESFVEKVQSFFPESKK